MKHDSRNNVMGTRAQARFISMVMKFKINKISHEHIYWDQASVLVQIGLLKPEKISITGIEQTKKLVELSKKN